MSGWQAVVKMGVVVRTGTTTPRLASASVRMIGSIMKEERLATRRQRGTLFGSVVQAVMLYITLSIRKTYHLLFFFFL